MRIIFSSTCQPVEFYHWLDKIEDWFGIPCPNDFNRNELCMSYEDDIWIGYSVRHGVYALRIISPESYASELEDSVTFLLLDPPKPDLETITHILLLIRKALIQGAKISECDVQTIIERIDFPELIRAGDLLPGIPDEWVDLPVKIQFSCELSEWAGVNQSTFDMFAKQTFTDVVRTVYDKRHDGYLLHYSLISTEVIPLLAWDVDSSLGRMLKEKYKERDKVGIDFPSNSSADKTLFRLYQYLPKVGASSAPSYYGKPTVRLTVGGISKQAAYSNWMQCAAALRKMKL